MTRKTCIPNIVFENHNDKQLQKKKLFPELKISIRMGGEGSGQLQLLRPKRTTGRSIRDRVNNDKSQTK